MVNPADYARMTGAREGALPAVDTLGGTIRLTEYRPNYLKYEYTSAAPATAVFSEIFYDKGWTAWVDGVETPYFRADYLLRALELPAGRSYGRVAVPCAALGSGRGGDGALLGRRSCS